MQNSNKKTKILPSGLFTQSSTQKVTLSAVGDNIEEILNYAKKNLVTDKITESQSMSKKLIQKEHEYIRSQYSNGDDLLGDLNTQMKEYEQYVSEIPKYLITKLQEFSIRKAPEMQIEKSGVKNEEDEEDEDNGRKKKSAPKGKKVVNKKGAKENEIRTSKDEAEDEDEEEESKGRMQVEKEKKWDMYERDSEEEEKEWFKEDFGKKVDEPKGKKNAGKTAEKPKGKGRGKAAKKEESDDSERDNYDEEEDYEEPTTKKRGKKRATPAKKEESGENSPILKKTKITDYTQNSSATKKGGKSQKPSNKFFL